RTAVPGTPEAPRASATPPRRDDAPRLAGGVDAHPRSRSRIEVHGEHHDRFDEILTPEALRFLTALHDRFAERRSAHLAHNRDRQAMIDRGTNPAFASATRAIR